MNKYFIISCLLYFDTIVAMEFREMPILPIDDIESVDLVFEKRIKTKKNSIFYSLIPTEDGFLGIYRDHFFSNQLNAVLLDKRLKIVQDFELSTIGEDPRTFKHGPSYYVTDNTYCENKIYTLINKKTPILKLQYGPKNKDSNFPKGKNPTYISSENALYLISWFYPLELYRFNKTLSKVEKIYQGNDRHDNRFRGGTPGYATQTKGEFVGFGHYTVEEDGILKHQPFLWKFNLRTKTVETKVLHDLGSTIFDPVCIIQMDGDFYLISAESEHPWFVEQDYMTRIWKIVL